MLERTKSEAEELSRFTKHQPLVYVCADNVFAKSTYLLSPLTRR